MPKYAVARGRKVGMYDTYEECLNQVKGFPNAKFKKFMTVQEAENFIKENAGSQTQTSPVKLETVRPENLKPSTSFPVEKISPSNTAVNNLSKKISVMEEKLNKFISKSSTVIDNLKKRIQALEKKRLETVEASDKFEQNYDDLVCVEPLAKKPKLLDENKYNFITNENGFVIVYTDGACSKNGRMGARAGIGVWFDQDHPLNVSAPVKGAATNNNAEIQAATMAIKQASRAKVKKMILHTDSKFVINCITQWIHKWKKNNWKLANGGDVKNRLELEKLDSALKKMTVVEWKYVAGHRGIYGNEMADKLARKGAEEFKINVTYSNMDDDDDDDDLFLDVDIE